MGTQVKLPDGSIGEFPDSMDESQILEVLRKKFPKSSGEGDTGKLDSAESSRSKRQQSRSKRGAGGTQEMQEKSSLEKTRESNPVLADLIESPDMNLKVGPFDTGIPIPDPMARGLIGMGKGFSDIGRAIGIGESSESQRGFDSALTDASGTAKVGEVLGQALPFAGAGVAGAMAKVGRGAQVGIQSLIGSTEGGAIAAGTGGDQKDVATGLLVGGLIGAGAEALTPVISRAARTLVAKIKGAPAAGRLLDDAGRPTQELDDALESAGMTFDDFVRQSADDAGEALPESIVGAGRSGQYDDVVGAIEPNADRIAASRQLGMNPESAPLAVMTSDQAAQELGGALAAVPTSRASTELDRYTGELGDVADRYIEDIGGSLDRGAIDETVFNGMQDSIQRIKALENT